MNSLRPPAVPLVTVDPYFSIWSMADHLYDDHTRHWTTSRMAMVGLIRVDATTYRFCGRTRTDAPAWSFAREPLAMPQVSLEVRPLSTRYRFAAGGVELAVTFTTPLLLRDLDVLSRPASYVDFTVHAVDGKEHAVEIYFDVSAEAAVDSPDQQVIWGRRAIGQDESIYIGTWEQNVLGRRGDDVRIDWGYVHLVAPKSSRLEVGAAAEARGRFATGTRAPDVKDAGRRERVRDRWPVLSAQWSLGAVDASERSCTAVLAYEDIASIEYFGVRRPAYCFRNGATFDQILAAAVGEHDALIDRCEAFGGEVVAAARAAGGDHYAEICTLAYRQAIAAHKLIADERGTAIFLSKECFSNGCIGTVDVTYPSVPLFFLYAPELVRGMLEPVLRYASTPEWNVDYAPHDVGTYPRANGQVYGVTLGQIDAASQMPVEECGNVLILTAAISRVERTTTFAEKHWDHLSRWARYLESRGYDPENQLCTDDFAGHLAHNTNLSIKAIVGLAAFADLCDRRGLKEDAERYNAAAARFAERWEREALEGDHYRLTFDGAGSWSLKYNLLWDRVLGYNLFPAEIYRREVAHYLSVANRYGVPLDSRDTFTKADWLVWAACLSERGDDFGKLVRPLWDFLNETPVRTPFSDWYGTTDALERSFHHRSVVGGIFMKVFSDTMIGGGPA